MKYAADFRSIARNALKGKWGIAVVAGLIASLLGAIGSSGPELNVELNDGNFNALLLIVPCHRVVASDGLGGYGGRPDIKRAILRLEGNTAYEPTV